MNRRGLLIVAAVGVVLSVTCALAVAEIALRIAHFSFQAIPQVQFGWPQPDVIVNEFKSDPDLLWVTPDYQERLHRARSGTDVIFMGDSCVEFSRYPERTLGALNLRGEKFAVPGWSSEQGRAQMERDVSTLHPRVVVVEFGWNDHWDALGPPDDETHPSAVTVWLADHARVYQAYRKAVLGWQTSRQHTLPRRVAMERYRSNLRQIVHGAQSIGAKVVLVTAPTDQEVGAEPDYLRARHLRELGDLVPLHASYVQATRDVAMNENATLCDAAAEMDKLGRARRPFFRADGIHFTPPGDRFMGDLVSGCIQTALADGR